MVGEDDQGSEDQDRFDGQSFAIVVVTFSSPLQELGHVLRQLRFRRFGAIAVLDLVIVQLFRHGNPTTAEVRIVM